MKKDIITEATEMLLVNVYLVLTDPTVKIEVKEIIIKTMHELRKAFGNQTLYIQKDLLVTQAYKYWDKVYKIQVVNGLLSKQEACEKIADKISEVEGIQLKPQTIQKWLKDNERPRLECKIKEREGTLFDFACDS